MTTATHHTENFETLVRVLGATEAIRVAQAQHAVQPIQTVDLDGSPVRIFGNHWDSTNERFTLFTIETDSGHEHRATTDRRSQFMDENNSPDFLPVAAQPTVAHTSYHEDEDAVNAHNARCIAERNAKSRPLYQALAEMVAARKRCWRGPHLENTEWFDRWGDRIENIQDNLLPSGSGIDNGTTVDQDACTETKLVLHTSYHHMNDGGYYDGWTDHTITVRPTFGGITIKVGGRNRNDIKDYLADVFHNCLTQPYVE